MTLPLSGPISFNAINVELRQPGTANASLNQASYRALAGVPSGTISLSNFYGKQYRVSISSTFSVSTPNASLNVAAIGGYIAGISDITVNVDPGVYLYSTGTGTPGLTLSGGASGDTLTLVNNGFIMGMGGVGGTNGAVAGGSGGIALQLGYPTTVNNTNGAAYIGGGGGGGYSFGNAGRGGGGGAGGGAGGRASQSNTPGGAGGGIGASGVNGGGGVSTNGVGGGAGGGGGGRTSVIGPRSVVTNYYGSGAGGGRIFPGAGGAGGVSGGGAGGSANAAGGVGNSDNGGGGGGWGAAGGGGGSSGGRAVYLNGQTVTWTSGDTTRVYGAVSN